MAEKLTIIVAEDNPKDFEFLEKLFENWDIPPAIERAQNGADALDLALKHQNPLVVSDIQMPEMNGIEFAKALWEKRPTTRIVFWSQFKDEMYVRALVKIVPPETV